MSAAGTENKIPLLVVVGPTASGKTALAVTLARRYHGEVVSADSMQIYMGMNIATAKPDPSEMNGVRHHLMDFLPPDVRYSVADFVRDARACIADLFRAQILPVVAGGTGLYVDSLIHNIQYAEIPADGQVRSRLEARAQREGTAGMLRELAQIDPEAASRLHENDQKRIIRALEIYQVSGVTMTEYNRRSRTVESPYLPFIIGLQARDRSVLYDRIDRRVDQMVQSGLIEEARAFFASAYSATAVQAIGYKELRPYFSGALSLEQAVEDIKRETRRYAKRQLSWFRRNPDINWFYLDDYSSAAEMAEAVCTAIEKRCDFIGGKKEKEE